MIRSSIPFVIEKTSQGERSYDIWSRLLLDRIIYLGSEIDDHVANAIVAQLLFLEKDDKDKDVEIYINSPGGSVSDGLAIYDAMQIVKPDIATVCVGQAASMAAILLAGGAKGKRVCLPNSRVMIHQVSSGFRGTASDINIQVAETNKYMEILVGILSFHTGKKEEQIRKDIDRDFYMSAPEALAYGVCDKIVGSKDRK